MKITSLVYARNTNRINVFIDKKYCFSLDESQILDCGIKVGLEVSESDIKKYELASSVGKLFQQAIKYCVFRLRSRKEVECYINRIVKKSPILGLSENSDIIADIERRLQSMGLIDDTNFARSWVEGRFQKKGISMKRLAFELEMKGVDRAIISDALIQCERNDSGEIKKIILRKQKKYDRQKLVQYLIRQGFKYDDIIATLQSMTD